MVQAGRCPFVTRGIAAASFVGRHDEVKLIVRQMESDSPTSIDVMGDRSVGIVAFTAVPGSILMVIFRTVLFH